MEPDTEYSELLQRYRHYADDSPEAHQRRDDARLALTEERELRQGLALPSRQDTGKLRTCSHCSKPMLRPHWHAPEQAKEMGCKF